MDRFNINFFIHLSFTFFIVYNNILIIHIVSLYFFYIINISELSIKNILNKMKQFEINFFIFPFYYII